MLSLLLFWSIIVCWWNKTSGALGGTTTDAKRKLQRSRNFVCQAPEKRRHKEGLLFGSSSNNNDDTTTCSLDDASWPLTPQHKSLLANHLTPALYSELALRITPTSGYTIDDLILRGVERKQVAIGLVAGDAECYGVFPEIFKPIMESFHHLNSDGRSSRKKEKEKMGLVMMMGEEAPTLSIDGKHVLSFRIRAARNIEGYDFVPYMTTEKRRELAGGIRAALDDLSPPLSSYNSDTDATNRSATSNIQNNHVIHRHHRYHGYIDPSTLSKEELDHLVEKNLWRRPPTEPTLLFGYDGNPKMWPIGRALWLSGSSGDDVGGGERGHSRTNSTTSTLLWINEEDHLRVVALETGMNQTLDHVLEEWTRFMSSTQDTLYTNGGYSFVYHEKLGYLATCPSNVGTGLRISVRMDLGALSKAKIRTVCRRYSLEVRFEKGTTPYCQVSNQQRLGLTPEETLRVVTQGVNALLNLETMAQQTRITPTMQSSSRPPEIPTRTCTGPEDTPVGSSKMGQLCILGSDAEHLAAWEKFHDAYKVVGLA